MKKYLICLLAVCLFIGTAAADSLVWPEKTAIVAAETFLNDSSLDEVILPPGVTVIGSRAFAFSSLRHITLPGNADISADAFEGCGPLTVDVPSGSPNAAFAAERLQLIPRVFSDGILIAGEDLSPNVYIITAVPGSVASVTLQGGPETITRAFTGSLILQVHGGEQLELRNASAIVDYEFDQSGHLPAADGQGMLRVGIDIAPGTYAVTPVDTAGTLTFYSDYRLHARSSLVIDDAWLAAEGSVTLREGDLISYEGLRFPRVSAPVRRALIISQTYPDTPSMTLQGPVTDGRGMHDMLTRLTGTPFTAARVSNLTASDLLSAVVSAFSDAQEDDISLLYYSGHGFEGGELVGTDINTVTPSRLRQALDQIPGVKILLVDACYSGGLLVQSASVHDPNTASGAAGFVSAFTDAFADVISSSPDEGFAAQSYYVMTACAEDELAFERNYTVNGSRVKAGIFTYGLCMGCGWDELYRTPISSLPADDGDGRLTLNELYAYVARYVAGEPTPEFQTVSVSPSGSDYVLFIP